MSDEEEVEEQHLSSLSSPTLPLRGPEFPGKRSAFERTELLLYENICKTLCEYNAIKIHFLWPLVFGDMVLAFVTISHGLHQQREFALSCCLNSFYHFIHSTFKTSHVAVNGIENANMVANSYLIC